MPSIARAAPLVRSVLVPMDGSTHDLLALVRKALDEIDDRPVAVTARRCARIASALGDSELAVRLGLELKPHGGHPQANANDTRRLMHDPSTWGDPTGPAERAMTAYMAVRRVDDERVDGRSLTELELWLAKIQSGQVASHDEWLEFELRNVAIIEQVRHTCFAALCAWERQLAFANVNEQIFERFRSVVDARLAAEIPEVLAQFSAVYRRLREAAQDRSRPVGEELAQAVTTCRRILKAVVDHLLPGINGAATADGHALDDAAYRNRVYEWLKTTTASHSTDQGIRASLGGLFDRFEATDRLASKGVHATVGLSEAESCAIHTYLLAGELLSVAEALRDDFIERP